MLTLSTYGFIIDRERKVYFMAKVKVQITLEDELLNMVDDYCDKNFMNRSWLISQSLIQVLNHQRLVDSIQNLSVAIKNCSMNGDIDEQTRKEMQNFETLCTMFMSK